MQVRAVQECPRAEGRTQISCGTQNAFPIGREKPNSLRMKHEMGSWGVTHREKIVTRSAVTCCDWPNRPPSRTESPPFPNSSKPTEIEPALPASRSSLQDSSSHIMYMFNCEHIWMFKYSVCCIILHIYACFHSS